MQISISWMKAPLSTTTQAERAHTRHPHLWVSICLHQSRFTALVQTKMLAGSNSCCQCCMQSVLVCAAIVSAGSCSMHLGQAQLSCCSSGKDVHQHHVQPSKLSNRQKSQQQQQQQQQLIKVLAMPTRMLVLSQLPLSGVQWLGLASLRMPSSGH